MSREPDIVKRLRDIAGEWADAEIREEAADEIERLRAALRPFAKMYAAPGGDLDKAIAIARAALEPQL